MTIILTHLLSFTTGFTICSILSWKIHRRHKQAWQKEYRRLMGGIEKTRQDIATLMVESSTGDKPTVNMKQIYVDIDDLWWNNNVR